MSLPSSVGWYTVFMEYQPDDDIEPLLRSILTTHFPGVFIVVDGVEGGTGASPEILQEHTGIPTLAAVCEARAALQDIGLYGEVQPIIAGGIRNGVDAAKAMALGADAVYVGTSALIALNCNRPLYVEDYAKIGAAPYHCHHCHTGLCPVGIATQDPELMARLDIEAGAERVANFFRAMTGEIQTLARACGKSIVHIYGS